jgi:rubrerythrin
MEKFDSINAILDFAIEREQEAVEFYSKMAENAPVKDMKEAFSQFAREEMAHKAKLISIKETGNFKIQEPKVIDLKIADYLVEVKEKADMTYQEVLVLAMQKEKAAFKLYQNLASKATDGNVKSIFLSLAQEEAKHKLRFEIEYDEFVLREN